MSKKTAIVTGSSRGIGKATAIRLAELGFTVICSARSEESSEAVVSLMDEIRKLSPDSMYVRTDISNDEDRKNLIDTVFSEFGRLDVLVNNAGVAPDVREDILQMKKASMDKVLSINLYGTFFLTQYAANKMIENKCGDAIINVTSMSAYTSSTNRGEYCISKAGVSMVTLLFADKLAEYGIPVFEVRPGIIKTPMTEVVSAKYDKLIAEGVTPIKRWGTPEDVAKCVLAAAGGLLDFGTGTVLNADGGFHIRRL
jgi:NAD(P)-dependent dehydrogenase (short-subunit alcohol dehydrogenase family)